MINQPSEETLKRWQKLDAKQASGAILAPPPQRYLYTSAIFDLDAEIARLFDGISRLGRIRNEIFGSNETENAIGESPMPLPASALALMILGKKESLRVANENLEKILSQLEEL